MNIRLQVFVGKYPGMGLLDGMVSRSLTVITNYQTVFQSGYTILHLHQQWMRFLVVPHSVYTCYRQSFKF